MEYWNSGKICYELRVTTKDPHRAERIAWDKLLELLGVDGVIGLLD